MTVAVIYFIEIMPFFRSALFESGTKNTFMRNVMDCLVKSNSIGSEWLMEYLRYHSFDFNLFVLVLYSAQLSLVKTAYQFNLCKLTIDATKWRPPSNKDFTQDRLKYLFQYSFCGPA